jgi:hypothetical protein
MDGVLLSCTLRHHISKHNSEWYAGNLQRTSHASAQQFVGNRYGYLSGLQSSFCIGEHHRSSDHRVR